MKILKSISCAGTNLNIYNNVGIMVSGGVDSAILLYYLMKHSKDKIHIFSYNSPRFNVTNLRVNISVAIQVVETCIKLTDNTNIEHHISYCDNLYDMPEQFIEEKRIKIVYSGVTSIPPKKVTDTFKLPSLEHHNRDSNVKRDVLKNLSLGKYYSPYTNIDKKIIASMYKEENLIKKLYTMTRSCAYEPKSKHNFFENIKDPGLGHCGVCWWCEERNWAFEGLQ